jgi:hypothetical protein
VSRFANVRGVVSGWWSAWKYVAILAALLAASLWGNALQWRAKAVAKEQARAETLQDVVKATAGIARQAQADNRQLLADLNQIAERGQRVKIKYQTLARTIPLPANCAPGKPRMDAVNEGADK